MGFKSRLRRREGQALVLTAVTLLLLVGLCAFAIDLGMAYAVKAKLNSAVDAAALEAGRSVKSGASDSERITSATQAATNFFTANFPTGILGTTLVEPSPSIDKLEHDKTSGTWTIGISASAVAPVFFGRIFDKKITVVSSAEATIKTLDMMIVLDCSGSMADDFTALQTAAKTFVNGFQDGEGGDRIGLVTFASGADLDPDAEIDDHRGYNKTKLNYLINAADAIGATNAEEAMRLAKDQLDGISESKRSTLRVIVFFSDGAPNIVSGTFTGTDRWGWPTTVTGGLWSQGKQSGDPNSLYTIDQMNDGPYTRNGIETLPVMDWSSEVNLAGKRTLDMTGGNNKVPVNNWCNVNKAARNMVENVANSARNSGITIYTIGLGAYLEKNEVDDCYKTSGASEYGENILMRLANTTTSDTFNSAQPTGTYVHADDKTELNSAFQKIKSIILRLNK